jgi:penicillin-binding protein A
MQFAREIQRLILGIVLAFVALALSAAYWAIYGADSVALREDNPRRVEAEAALWRGALYDRHETLLIHTEQDPATRALRRRYLFPSMASALGYSSLRYGVGGAEAAFDPTLRGDTLMSATDRYLDLNILHRQQRGADVRLTFDLAIQQQVHTALQRDGVRGAAVVLDVPNGAVLALVSLPDYDPNTLDADWERLTADAGQPFFNRALQGDYQIGGIAYTPQIAVDVLSPAALDTPAPNATAAVTLPNLNVPLTCTTPPPSNSLTLREAYLYGCPAPFRDAAARRGRDALLTTLADFRFDQPLTLDGFAPQAAAPAQSAPFNLTAEALGQGQTTSNPLHVATIIAALLNDGNAPAPHTLLATRAPDGAWVDVAPRTTTFPYTTRPAAQALRTLLIDSLRQTLAPHGQTPPATMGGQVALAYSGDTRKTWFVGFVQSADQASARVLVLVLETPFPDPSALPAAASTSIQSQDAAFALLLGFSLLSAIG